MGFLSKSKLHLCFFIILSFYLDSYVKAHVSAVISEKGIDFAKYLLLNKSISSMIPLEVPEIEKYVKIPVIGKVHVVLGDIIIYSVDIPSSFVQTGNSGISLVVSGATANLSMNWSYSYHTWLVPVPITDKGSASIEVQDMTVGVNVAIGYQEGTLKLSLLDCRCNVDDMSIKLNGGASWLYQVLVDAFQGKIVSSVENAISKKIREGMQQLDSKLQSLPKNVQLNSIAALNVTFTDSPVLSDSSVELEIDGLLIGVDEMSVSKSYLKETQDSVSCNGAKMLEFSLEKNVFDSASSLYLNANYMHWTVDKMPEQSLLNTAGWRYIIPELYKQYPNEDMEFNISIASQPVLRIEGHGISTTIHADLTIDVLHSDKVIPVACILVAMNASGSAKISNNNLAGSISLDDFSTSLKWSNIGSLHMYLIQSAMSTIIKTAVLPYLNLHLKKGLPVPLPSGYALENAEIVYVDSRVVICTDVASTRRDSDLEEKLTQYYLHSNH